MARYEPKEIRVAAIQMESQNGLIQSNLNRAVFLVEEAAKKGAQLILLPEFMPTGYEYSKNTWNAAEPKHGPTVRWLRENSKRLGVWLSTSFLEAEGEDFFNTFVLTGPDGEEAGRVRKQTPAIFEAFFFKGDSGPHIVETEFARIGVGICYENQLSYLPYLMNDQSADLVLMPHSAPTPMQSLFIPRKLVDIYNRELGATAERMANRLGVPVIMANKCGPWRSSIPWLPMFYQDSTFPGLSAIVDSDGTIKAKTGNEESIIVEDVTLDPSNKTGKIGRCFGRWAYQGPWQRNLWRAAEVAGRFSYSNSTQRKRKALEISSKRER